MKAGIRERKIDSVQKLQESSLPQVKKKFFSGADAVHTWKKIYLTREFIPLVWKIQKRDDRQGFLYQDF